MPHALKSYFFFLLLIFLSGNSVFSQCSVNAGPDQISCVGDVIQLGSVSPVTGGNGPFFYSWSPTTNLSCATCPNPTASISVTTSYVVTAYNSDSSCFDRDTVLITFIPNPTASFTFTGNLGCSSVPIQFTNTSVVPGSTYAWNFGNPESGASNTSTATNPNHAFVAYGNTTQSFVVSLTVTNSAGCSSTPFTQTVTVTQSPDPSIFDFNSNTPFVNCANLIFDLTAENTSTTTATNTGYTISWGDGTPNFSNAVFPVAGVQHTYSALGYFDLISTVTGQNGCISSQTFNVYNGGNPAVGLGNPGGTVNLCLPNSLTFPITGIDNNPPGTIYYITSNAFEDTIEYNHPPPASYTQIFTESSCGATGANNPNSFFLRIRAENPCGFSESTVEPITTSVKPQADFTISPDTIICSNSVATFTNTSINGIEVSNNLTCNLLTRSNWLISPATGWNVVSGSLGLTSPTNNPSTWGSPSLGVQFTAPGTYAISVLVRNNCGNDTITKTICVENPPSPDFSLSQSIGCIGFSTATTNLSTTANTCNVTRNWSVTFNGSACQPSSGAWNYVGGTGPTSFQPQFQFNATGTYTIQLALTNKCGTFTHTETVVVQGPPQVSINAATSICAGGVITPTATVNECYESIDSYAWTFPSGSPTTSSQLAPGTISYANAGSFTIQLTVTNQCGNATASRLLTVNPIPTGINPSVVSPVCVGTSVQFSGNHSPGNTYSWTGPSGFSTTAQSPTISSVSLANAGTYQVITTNSGCSNLGESVQLIVNPAPIVDAGANFSRCQNGSSLPLVGSPAGGTWSGNGVIGATFNPAGLTVGNHTLTYSYTNPTTSCTATDQVIVTVLAPPIVNAGNDLSVCNQPVAVSLSGTPAGGTWSGSGVTNPSGEFTPSTTGNFTLTYSFTAANGCSNEDQMTISVINATTASAGNDTTICVNEGPIQLTGLPASGTWSGTGISASGVFTPTTSGDFDVVYSIGSGSCLTNDTLTITVNPAPTANAGLDFSICADADAVSLAGIPSGGTWTGTGIVGLTFDPNTLVPGNYTLTYTVSNASTGCSNQDVVQATVLPNPIVNAGSDLFLCNQPIVEQLSGSPAGGTWTGPGITNPSGTFLPTTNGVVNVVYSFTNAQNCSATDTIQITVGNPTLASAGNDTSVCINAAAVQLTGLPGGGTWSGSGVTSAGLFNPISEGTVELVYSIGSGTCQSFDTLELIVHPLPLVDAGTNQETCVDGNTIALSGIPAGGTWSGSGVVASGFSPSLAGVGTHVLTYTYTNPTTQCLNSDTKSILVNPLPQPNAGNDTTLCAQPIPVQFQGVPLGGTWSGNGIASGGLFTPSTVGSFSVFYTYELATGCAATDEKIITVVNAELAQAGLDLEACIFDPATQLSGLPLNGTWTGTNITSTGTFTPIQAGDFPLVYSVGAGTCLTHDTLIFTVHALPIVQTGSDESFCVSELSSDFSATPLGGIWSGTGITNPIAGTFNPTSAGVGTFDVVYTYSEPVTGCINTDTLEVIVHPLPVVSFVVDPIACAGTAETFTNTSTLGSQFAWDFGDGTTSILENPSHTFTSPGFYTIQLQVTSVFGCIDSIAQTIEVREPPVTDFSLTPDSSCAPVLVSFANNSTGIDLTYSWDFGNGQTSTAQNPGNQTYLQGVLADTTYEVELTVTNFCGSTIHTETVIAMPSPTAIFGTNLDIGCSPFTVEIANNSLGIPDTYSWDFGDGTTSMDPNALLDHVFTTGLEDTTYIITLTVSNECGTNSDSHPITVLPNQVNAFFNTNITSGCAPLTVNFTQFSTGASVYNWNFGDGNTSNQLSPTHTFTQAGTYEVNLFVNDGCSFDTASVVITVSPSPTVDFSFAPDSVCINEPFVFTNLSQNLANVSWDFGDGNSSTLTNPTHAFASSGTYQVTMTGTGAQNGCVSSVTKPVLVSVNPVPSFVANPISGCVPLTVNLISTGANVSFQAWDFGDGNISNALNPSHTFTAAGSFAIQLQVQNGNGCSDSSTQIITVYPLPIADFSFTNSDPCFAPVTLNTVNASSGATGYQWNFGNGTTSTLTNQTVIYDTPGTYTISLTATNSFGCQDVHTETFTVHPTPVAQFVISDLEVCVGESVTFISQSAFSDSVVWDLGDGTILTGNQVTHAYSFPSNFPIILTVYGAGGCTDVLILNPAVTVNPTPIAGFDYVNIQNPDPVSGTVEFTNTSINANSYQWFFGNGNQSVEENPIERYNQYGDFTATLIASNSFGCSDTIIQIVQVDFFSGLFVPNAMYPDHPDFGVSHFLPKGVGLETYELLIYDDWGNLIWQTTALDADGRPTEAWDGMFNGEPVQQDAYVWKVNATFLDTKAWRGKEYEKGVYKRSGTVTVIR